MNRIGKKYGGAKTRGQRVVVHHFVCPVCKNVRDILAKRRPTRDPDWEPEPPVCNHGQSPLEDVQYASSEMEHRGLLFMRVVDGKKEYEDASKLRAEWEAARARMLYGNVCECGHPWWEHRVDRKAMKAHECKKCFCQSFTRKKADESWSQLTARKSDDDVPF